jgi:hypothetical protein
LNLPILVVIICLSFRTTKLWVILKDKSFPKKRTLLHLWPMQLVQKGQIWAIFNDMKYLPYFCIRKKLSVFFNIQSQDPSLERHKFYSWKEVTLPYQLASFPWWGKLKWRELVIPRVFKIPDGVFQWLTYRVDNNNYKKKKFGENSSDERN